MGDLVPPTFEFGQQEAERRTQRVNGGRPHFEPRVLQERSLKCSPVQRRARLRVAPTRRTTFVSDGEATPCRSARAESIPLAAG